MTVIKFSKTKKLNEMYYEIRDKARYLGSVSLPVISELRGSEIEANKKYNFDYLSEDYQLREGLDFPMTSFLHHMVYFGDQRYDKSNKLKGILPQERFYIFREAHTFLKNNKFSLAQCEDILSSYLNYLLRLEEVYITHKSRRSLTSDKSIYDTDYITNSFGGEAELYGCTFYKTSHKGDKYKHRTFLFQFFPDICYPEDNLLDRIVQLETGVYSKSDCIDMRLAYSGFLSTMNIVWRNRRMKFGCLGKEEKIQKRHILLSAPSIQKL